MTDITHLPGEEFVRQGLQDLEQGETTTLEALLLQIGATRIRNAGVPVPDFPRHETDAELRLYFLLGEQHGNNAYSQYNAHIRRLISFEQSLEARSSRMRRTEQAAL